MILQRQDAVCGVFFDLRHFNAASKQGSKTINSALNQPKSTYTE
jgi:hypothetical protein